MDTIQLTEQQTNSGCSSPTTDKAQINRSFSQNSITTDLTTESEYEKKSMFVFGRGDADGLEGRVALSP